MSSTQAPRQTTTVQRLFQHLLHADAEFRSLLLRNGRSIRLAEDGLRGLALLLPGGDGEIRAEAAGVLLSWLQIYRDAGSPDIPKDVLKVGNVEVSSKALMVMLATTRAVELLVEMVAERRGRSKWGAVTGIEGAKMLLRLMLLVCRLRHGLGSEELPNAKEEAVCTCGLGNLEGAKYVNVKRGKRTGRKVYVLNDSVPEGKELDILFETAYERRSAWIMQMLGAEENCPACSPGKGEAEKHSGLQQNGAASPNRQQSVAGGVYSLPPEATFGEVLYIMRPFLQLLFIRKYGWKSWRAWLLALGVDLFARNLRTRDRTLHEDERQRRNLQLLLYLARSPFFDVVIKRILETSARGLRRIPLIGGVASSTLELTTALQTYWFYTAAS